MPSRDLRGGLIGCGFFAGNQLHGWRDARGLMLGHMGDVTSVVDCSYATILAAEPFPETFVEVDATAGSIRLGQGYRMVVTTRAGSRETNVAPPMRPWASRPWHNIQESVASIQQHWIDNLRSGKEHETSGKDNLKTLGLVEAAYLSAETGTVVNPARL